MVIGARQLSAHRRHDASISSTPLHAKIGVFLSGLVNWLEHQIAPVDDGAAESERNFVVQLILISALDRFADGRQHFRLDRLHVGDVGAHRPCSSGLANRRGDRRLRHVRI